MVGFFFLELGNNFPENNDPNTNQKACQTSNETPTAKTIIVTNVASEHKSRIEMRKTNNPLMVQLNCVICNIEGYNFHHALVNVCAYTF